ncbi:MAG: hypothetical protein ACPGMQ_01140 [Pirellulales bacterium]
MKKTPASDAISPARYHIGKRLRGMHPMSDEYIIHMKSANTATPRIFAETHVFNGLFL